MTAYFNENSPGCECQLNSTVQRTSGGQKVEEVKEVKEWEVEKILNKRKVRGVVKYLVH